MERIPGDLPPDLAEFLSDQQYACLTQPTSVGTVLVIKAPGVDIDNLRGPVAIHLRQELHDNPWAPVIRLVLAFYDAPEYPLAFETFINVAAPDQRDDYTAMARQRELHLLLYDEKLSHRLTKGIRAPGSVSIGMILNRADALRAAISSDDFDFDRAKAEVMLQTSLRSEAPALLVIEPPRPEWGTTAWREM